jgi:hypothetical protein
MPTPRKPTPIPTGDPKSGVLDPGPKPSGDPIPGTADPQPGPAPYAWRISDRNKIQEPPAKEGQSRLGIVKQSGALKNHREVR